MLKALLGLGTALDETKTVDFTPEGEVSRLQVKVHSGDVTVRHWDQPHVQADVHVRVRGDENKPMEAYWNLRQVGTEVQFEQAPLHNWIFGPHVCVDVVLYVPEAITKGNLKSSNGFLEVEGFNGAINAHTSNGGIRVVDVEGDVHAHTHNGHVEISQIDGAVDATSHNGILDVGKVTSNVKAHTHNGQIHLQDCGAIVNISTHNGKIKIHQTVPLQGAWSVETSNGGIDLFVPSNTDATYNLHTSAGRITGSAIPVKTSGFSQHLSVTTGQGTHPVHIRTSAGGIVINHN
ncbi:DUF4097 family beta strand repeat-containing protein [Tumebacillus flagellatus]|uniref:DUF4097 domain-containing protein n=1 Tax=Tumebacillus flagellatus TaxID=1157490 RepID=A0A074LMC2_9BACL|nr:DUF4097 family beta strand repeat-containing protein [Tumebacillus flagellatus]KEO82264.1 hypothetical protein EL26_16575 [Tumebacillus flagellatus]